MPTGIICHKSKDEIAGWTDKNRITPHWSSWKDSVVIGIVMTCVLLSSGNDLKLMPVKMKRMCSCIVIIQNYVNDVALVEDKGICVLPINCRICGCRTGGQYRV
ncbi:hypothetical protein PHISCL_08720 [Aspergillus sclerotialis]|uniref:Uncharacterized protein n=1 Tax=Aspergillus sclerotialis TaxID=2070753 RepID=A0A3A2ZPD0_9EURO|nr:hypothetical protein PHISCL_08720 [Aspergillus sclerotialis]